MRRLTAAPAFVPPSVGSEAVRSSAWTFRLALLGVLLGSLAISLEALSLAQRLSLSSTLSRSISLSPSLSSPSSTLSGPAVPPEGAPLDISPPAAPSAAVQSLTDSLLGEADERMLAPREREGNREGGREAEGVLANGSSSGLERLLIAAEPAADDLDGAGVAAKGGGRGRRRREGKANGGRQPHADRPNLVLLVADDASPGDINAYRASSGGAAARVPAHLALEGPTHGLTPNLDGVARRGVRC